uniref:Uncharacterized protein n=1 Tax=Cacopsylla melanoneura TaxID=428564 RepID=A0A8D9F2T0_9HEMI
MHGLRAPATPMFWKCVMCVYFPFIMIVRFPFIIYIYKCLQKINMFVNISTEMDIMQTVGTIIIATLMHTVHPLEIEQSTCLLVSYIWSQKINTTGNNIRHIHVLS